MERIAFKAAHIDLLVMRAEEKENLIVWNRIKDALDAIEKMNQAMTLVHDGRIITCAGFWMCGTGVCEIWQIPSIYVKDVQIEYCKIMNGYIETLAKTFSVHRMQTISPVDELHRRWMGYLGFECEGTLKQYTVTKQDQLMWARFF